jgi:FtsZ-binding cell division protein ZapB
LGYASRDYLEIFCCILVFQVAEVKKLSAQEQSKARMKALEAENEQLRKEIEEWKNKLIQLETANGIKQVVF